MSQTIPTATTLADYEQTTTLDGRDYLLRFTFNEREGFWYMSMSDQDSSPIVTGLKVAVDFPLLKRVTDARRPPGTLMAKDLATVDVDIDAGEKLLALDPGLEELGARVLLVYFTAAELAAES